LVKWRVDCRLGVVDVDGRDEALDVGLLGRGQKVATRGCEWHTRGMHRLIANRGWRHLQYNRSNLGGRRTDRSTMKAGCSVDTGKAGASSWRNWFGLAAYRGRRPFGTSSLDVVGGKPPNAVAYPKTNCKRSQSAGRIDLWSWLAREVFFIGVAWGYNTSSSPQPSSNLFFKVKPDSVSTETTTRMHKSGRMHKDSLGLAGFIVEPWTVARLPLGTTDIAELSCAVTSPMKQMNYLSSPSQHIAHGEGTYI
jgi:hypothetical protein